MTGPGVTPRAGVAIYFNDPTQGPTQDPKQGPKQDPTQDPTQDPAQDLFLPSASLPEPM